MKKIILVMLVLISLLGGITVKAEDAENTKDLYLKQYETSRADDAFELLPEDTKTILDSLYIDPKSPESFADLKSENIFSVIWQFIKGGASTPLKITTLLLGMIIIFAALQGMEDGGVNSLFGIIICLGGSMLLLQPVLSLINGVSSGIEGITTFMLGFIPVYAGIMTTSGYVSTAGGFSTMLLAATEVVAQFISFGLVPAVSGCVSLGISGAISPVGGAAKIAEFFKKSYLWIMGVITTVFLGVLSLQTTVTASADNLGLRTSKAVLSGAIPVMGPAISETLATAKGCLTLLRSGVGIYGAIAVILISLPIVIELFLWHIGLCFISAVAEIFGMTSGASLFKAIDFGLTILIGSVIFVAMLFIIALTVVVPK